MASPASIKKHPQHPMLVAAHDWSLAIRAGF